MKIIEQNEVLKKVKIFEKKLHIYFLFPLKTVNYFRTEVL